MQWYRPEKYISFSYIETLLDNITQKVLNYLRNEHPAHSIFSTSNEQLSLWKHNNINENYWNTIEAKQIKNILDKIIFDLDFYEKNPWISSNEYNEKDEYVRYFLCLILIIDYHQIL